MPRAFVRPGSRTAVMRPVRSHRSRRPGVAVGSRGPLRPGHPGSTGRRPVRSGRFHRILWPVGLPILVIPEIADHLTAVLEEFAQANGSTAEGPLKIVLRPGTLGLHRVGRAVDIYGVGGKGIGRWVTEWNASMRKAAAAKDAAQKTRISDDEKARNLGYKLYKALQARGGWAQPPGYPVQLFGPWTRVEGPHKAISDRLLKLHRDHIHVAR